MTEEFNKDYDYPLVMESIEGEVPNWYQDLEILQRFYQILI